jgi:hypothetical protein
MRSYEHNLCCYAEEKLLKNEKKKKKRTWEVRAAVGLVAPGDWPPIWFLHVPPPFILPRLPLTKLGLVIATTGV